MTTNAATTDGDQPEPRTPDRLLVAADQRFAVTGYVNTRLADITSDAGLTTGALYRYFPGKDELPIALLRLLEAAIARMASQVEGPHEALAALVERLNAHRGALRLLFESSSWRGDGKVADPVGAASSALAQHLDLGLSARRTREVATFVANLLFHHVHAIHAGGLEPRTPDEIATTINKMLDTGVYPLENASFVPDQAHNDEVRHTPFVRWFASDDRALPRSAKGIRTRKEIQDAAARVFHKRGLTDTTMSDIAREAGLASGSVYRYFVDKADILWSMQAEVEEAIIRESHLPLDQGKLAIREQMLAYLACYERHLGPIRAWLELAEPGTDMAAAWNGMRNQFIRRVVRVLEYGNDAGITRTDLDFVLVSQLHSMAYESAAYARFVRDTRGSSPRQLADTMHRLFIGGFRQADRS